MIIPVTSRGAIVEKTPELLKRCITELHVKPLTHPDFPELDSFDVYQEDEKKLYLPVHWAQKVHPETIMRYALSDEQKEKIPEERFTFNGAPREHQLSAVETSLVHLKTNGRGILCLQTGGGKTFTSLYLAAKLGHRILVVIHKRSLLQQWENEIKAFLPNATIGYLWQKHNDTKADIVLAMWQTLLKRKDVTPTWNTIIVDECHRICSKEFSQIMFKVNAQYAIGLSATPSRKDGLLDVLYWHLGPIMYQQAPTSRSTLPVLVKQLSFHTPDYDRYRNSIAKQYVKVISTITGNPERTRMILKEVIGVTKRKDAAERYILILTERVKHAELLHAALGQIFSENPDISIGLFIGSQTMENLTKAKDARIIVATYKIFEEGESIERLNTLIMASPKKDVRQSIGRIFRKVHSINPIIIDISDSLLAGMARKRLDTIKTETNGLMKNVTEL